MHDHKDISYNFAKERVKEVDELIVRPKYSHHTSTQRKKRVEPNNDLLSTVFAAKLLVAVIFLSVFALCNAANTPTTNFIISKVKVIATSNYDVNKYLIKVATGIGIKLPENTPAVQVVSGGNNLASEVTDNQVRIDNKEVQNQGEKISNKSGVNNNDITTGSTDPVAQIQTVEDVEIKAIADKFSFIMPIKGDITSTFGTRTDPLSGDSEFHSGIDIKANMGTSIKAALGGEVIEVGSNPQYHKYIKIKHNDGIETVYAFCSILIAKNGQKVNQGDVVAKVGDTEGISGSDLHFEIWKNNKAVDPEKLLNYLNQ